MSANRPIIVERSSITETGATGRFRVGRQTNEVHFEGVAPDAASAAAAFAAIGKVMGMETNRAVLSAPRLSRTFVRSMDALQDTHLELFPHHHRAPLRALPRRERPADAATDQRRVAAFFSGGVDSIDLVLEHDRTIDDLLFVRGFDVEVHDTARTAEVQAWVQEAADALGKPLLVIDTDLRDFSDPVTDWTWFVYGGLVATSLMLARTHRLVLCAASVADQHLPGDAARLRRAGFGDERTELRIEGRTATRVEKLTRVAQSGVARSTLRVCWQNEPGTLNCGRCDKCLRTMVGLAAVGLLDEIESLPADIDLDALSRHPASSRSDRAYLSEAHEAAESNGHHQIAAALARALDAAAPTAP